MKYSKMTIMMSLVVFFAATLLGSGALAATDPEGPSGEPPYGVAIQSDAAGQKLIGVLFIEYYNIDPQNPFAPADARIFIRLRKGNVLKMFYAEAFDVDISDPANNQEDITEAIKDEILEGFFGSGSGLEITLKSMDDFIQVDAGTPISTFVMADVVIAVK
ncbi:MAG: hypothetical protein ACYTF1_24310 [Planctomycetota bacterium]|jgi:hypothetical protein